MICIFLLSNQVPWNMQCYSCSITTWALRSKQCMRWNWWIRKLSWKYGCEMIELTTYKLIWTFVSIKSDTITQMWQRHYCSTVNDSSSPNLFQTFTNNESHRQTMFIQINRRSIIYSQLVLSIKISTSCSSAYTLLELEKISIGRNVTNIYSYNYSPKWNQIQPELE